MLFVVACSPNDDPVGRMSGSRGETSTSPEFVAEAAEFGGLVLPANAEVLQARVDSALDTSYQLALRTDPGGVTTLIAESRFTDRLTKAYPPFAPVIAGPSLASSPLVLEGQDRYHNAAGTLVYRTVIVDERAPDIRIVHLTVFTT